MEYNSQRTDMILPEYGRNIQKMVRYALTVEDREERNKVAQGIINVMGMLNPHLRDVEEFKPKLWAHLFVMSEFQLDVDSPFPIPKPEQFEEKPRRVPYPQTHIRFKHYGRTAQLLINHAKTMEDNEERDALILRIGNLMKRNYLTWNRESVDDQVIADNLHTLSNDELILKDPSLLISTHEVLKSPQNGMQNSKHRKGGNKKKGNKKKR